MTTENIHTVPKTSMSERPYMYTYIYFLGSGGSCFVSTINRRINYLTEFRQLTITSAPQTLGFHSLSVFCVLTSYSDLSKIPPGPEISILWHIFLLCFNKFW